jgi:hypothetical protein
MSSLFLSEILAFFSKQLYSSFARVASHPPPGKTFVKPGFESFPGGIAGAIVSSTTLPVEVWRWHKGRST